MPMATKRPKGRGPMAVVAGLDVCAEGWLCARRDPADGRIEAAVLPSLDELEQLSPEPVAVGVDIPIGLPEAGPRECDRRARALLGRPRASSVFPVPLRAMLEADSYQAACALGERTDGRRLPRQSWHLLPRIREMDTFLRADPSRVHWVREVHPEMSFRAWHGGWPMVHGKRTVSGSRERAALVDRDWGASWRAAGKGLGQGAARHDLLDALAALWSAERFARGRAVQLPGDPPRDAMGLAMAIAY